MTIAALMNAFRKWTKKSDIIIFDCAESRKVAKENPRPDKRNNHAGKNSYGHCVNGKHRHHGHGGSKARHNQKPVPG